MFLYRDMYTSAWMVDTFGNEEQRQRFLPQLVTLDVRTTS